MAIVDIKIPQMGEGLTEVRVLEFLKRPGDTVAKDELIYTMETDKATLEVESPEAGTLTEMGAAHIELLTWLDARDPDRIVAAGSWLREAAGDEGLAVRGWADFAEAAGASIRGVDGSDAAARALAAAEETGDRRLAAHVRTLSS